MDFKRCENGHYYDAERFDSCPHCAQGNISTVMQNDEGEPQYTMPMQVRVSPAPQPEPSSDPSFITHSSEDPAKTIGFFGDVQEEPVVGWLVAIEGDHFGLDFKLKSGRNFIGRSRDMDVSLYKDSSVSRDKHAIILYEPRNNIFLVQPGDAKELFYLNEKVVLTATEINAYDVLSLGGTKLLFIPCCSDKFNWESVMPKEEKK